MNRLRSLLRDYYPQALQAFPNLAHRTTAVVLRAAPTPAEAARLTPRRVVSLLKRAGRRNDEGLADTIACTLRSDALRLPAPVEHALGVAAVGLIDTITAMSDAIAALEGELADTFNQHAQAEVITSMPGLGPVLAARVLGELGDDLHGSRTFVRCAASPTPPRSPARPGAAAWWRPGGSVTVASAMPATGGRSPPSPSRPAPEPTTTGAASPATPTTRRYATSRTSSSPSSGTACRPTPSTTKRRHGRAQPTPLRLPLLDS